MLLARLPVEQDVSVRWRLAYALEKLPDPRRIVPAVAPLLRDPDPLVRAHAARTLARERSAFAVGPLLASIGDADAAVVVNVLRALQQIADSTNSHQIAAVAPLLAHRDPYVRVTAATVLADPFMWWLALPADSLAAGKALTAGLADPDAATRGACGRALLAHEGLHAWPRVRGLLADSTVYVRTALLDGFRAMDSARWHDDTVVATALQALASAVTPGQPLLQRMTAAEVAGQLHGKFAHDAEREKRFAELLPLLRDGVDDSDVLYAASCAGALGDWGDTSSVAHLTIAYATRGLAADADARIGIRDALRQLAGRAYADSVEKAHAPAAAPAHRPPGWELPPAEHHATIHTSAGDIEWQFLGDEAPQTVRNFVTLAKRHYFDGLRVHRVVPDFVFQDGDPTGTGSGGPGYTIRCEYNHERYETGMVGMALSGKDTGGSQWFITLSPQPHLNGRYTIFARVTRGLDVARRITQGARIERVEVRP